MAKQDQAKRQSSRERNTINGRVGNAKEFYGRYVDFPLKVVGVIALIFLGIISWVQQWLSYQMIVFLVSVVAIVGVVGIWLLFKFLPQSRWLQGCWTVLAVMVLVALCLGLPAPVNWNRVAVPVASDVAAPLSLIRHELNGRMYPGARTYAMKIEAERLTNGYNSPEEEFIVFQSSFITPNAVPRTIRLKRNGPPAAIAAYVFANDNTYPLIHKLGIQRSCTEVGKFGFSKPVRELTFEVPKDDSTKETKVVLFVFPLSKQAADTIGDDITDFAEIMRNTKQ